MCTKRQSDASEKVERPSVEASAEIAALLAANRSDFLAFLERRVGSRAIAEDILQEAFSRGLDRLETLRSEESAVAWFYRMLRNAVVDYYRRQKSAARALEAFSAELSESEEPAEDVAEAVCKCVGRLAGTLKPEYAEALRRVEVDGVAVKSFADEAGISSNNAAVRIFRAREALRRQVVASCGACATHGCLNCTCEAPAELG
jgi:RNA polymerase sigma-70 factor (ECF subfamily)